MDGSGYNFHFQESSAGAGAGSRFPSSLPGLDNEDLQSYTQPHPMAPPRSDMSNLDLNSHGTGFADLNSYTGLLQSGISTGTCGRSLFQPPRQSLGGAGSGSGGVGGSQLGRGFGGSRAGRGGEQQQLHRTQGNQHLPAGRGRGRGLPPMNTVPARGRRLKRAPCRGRGASSSGIAGDDDDDSTSEDDWIVEYVNKCHKRRLELAISAAVFGAIDGTHVRVVVPTSHVIQHTGRKGHTTQNVMAICDFDMRFTFVVAGWPGSVHDMRVFKHASQTFEKFPHPPEGKFYLVDSGYPNRHGYLAPYRGTINIMFRNFDKVPCQEVLQQHKPGIFSLNEVPTFIQ